MCILLITFLGEMEFFHVSSGGCNEIYSHTYDDYKENLPNCTDLVKKGNSRSDMVNSKTILTTYFGLQSIYFSLHLGS